MLYDVSQEWLALDTHHLLQNDSAFTLTMQYLKNSYLIDFDMFAIK